MELPYIQIHVGKGIDRKNYALKSPRYAKVVIKIYNFEIEKDGMVRGSAART